MNDLTSARLRQLKWNVENAILRLRQTVSLIEAVQTDPALPVENHDRLEALGNVVSDATTSLDQILNDPNLIALFRKARDDS